MLLCLGSKIFWYSFSILTGLNDQNEQYISLCNVLVCLVFIVSCIVLHSLHPSQTVLSVASSSISWIQGYFSLLCPLVHHVRTGEIYIMIGRLYFAGVLVRHLPLIRGAKMNQGAKYQWWNLHEMLRSRSCWEAHNLLKSMFCCDIIMPIFFDGNGET